MWITAVRVKSYKSFLDSGDITFKRGFNVIVGQNNAGKSALAQIMSLDFDNVPHKSLETSPKRGQYFSDQSSIDIHFELAIGELVDLLPKQAGEILFPILDDNDLQQRWLLDVINKKSKEADDNILKISCCFSPERKLTLVQVDGFYSVQKIFKQKHRAIKIKFNNSSQQFESIGLASAADQSLFIHKLPLHMRGAIYKFNAERLNVTQSARKSNPNLKSDASNLPEVLHYLYNTNRRKYSRFEDAVKTVFPHITAISTPPQDQNVEIRIWSIDMDTDRDDLTFNLQDSGTGIGQVLAMLYVVINYDNPRIIIIDEPQSFLHPGALRKLFDIFRQYPQHQYIITTHSPTAVMAANPQTITLLKRENMKTIVQSIDAKKNNELQLYLAEVGARLSDVFGADNILWVEGPTEEQCFPKILQHFKLSLLGTKIVGVLHTGDFEGKHKSMVLRIYNKLSAAQGILPPAIGFIFDREDRSETEIVDMEREGKGRIHFLSRKLYENYVIHPAAICAVMNSMENFRGSEIKAEEIESWIDKHKWDREYYTRQPTNKQMEDSNFWLHRIHGATFLHDMFKNFADESFSYKSDKVYYAVHLTEWILENDEQYLSELYRDLKEIIDNPI